MLFTMTGCGTIAGEYATMALYAAEHKVLLFSMTPCSATHTDKPALVSAWVRERDIGKMVVVCDPNCNCRLMKRKP